MEVEGTGLPGQYYRLMTLGITPVQARLAAGPLTDLQALETEPGWRHSPSCILVAAVLYASAHPANARHGDGDLRALAEKVGDFLASESEEGRFAPRLDSHRDTYMWLEAYRLLEPELAPERRERWRREIERQVRPLAEMTTERQEFPRYQSPFISTSPNHYALWASTVYLAGRVFGNPEWERLGAAVLHRCGLL
jgi:plasmid stabilization system protein ParE